MENTSYKAANGQRTETSGDYHPDTGVIADRQLIEAIARGDDRAFVDIYQRHSTAIYNYLLRLIHDKALAEDLLQETFVAVWQGAGTFQRQSKVKTWIFQIAHNKSVSWLRRHRPQIVGEELIVSGEEPDPERMSTINWRNLELLRALDSLSPNHRAVIELVFVHGLAYAEVAEIMECPLGTVKSRISYALRHLYALLSNTDLR